VLARQADHSGCLENQGSLPVLNRKRWILPHLDFLFSFEAYLDRLNNDQRPADTSHCPIICEKTTPVTPIDINKVADFHSMSCRLLPPDLFPNAKIITITAVNNAVA
jgi:hypothetical protein